MLGVYRLHHLAVQQGVLELGGQGQGQGVVRPRPGRGQTPDAALPRQGGRRGLPGVQGELVLLCVKCLSGGSQGLLLQLTAGGVAAVAQRRGLQGGLLELVVVVEVVLLQRLLLLLLGVVVVVVVVVVRGAHVGVEHHALPGLHQGEHARLVERGRGLGADVLRRSHGGHRGPLGGAGRGTRVHGGAGTGGVGTLGDLHLVEVGLQPDALMLQVHPLLVQPGREENKHTLCVDSDTRDVILLLISECD